MKHILSALVLITLYSNSVAQLIQTHRYEVDKKFGDENFIVISAEENGIILFRETDEKVENAVGNIWEIVMLDTDLNLVWENKLAVDYKNEIIGYEYFDGFLYLLFEGEFSNRQREYFILKIDHKDGSNQKFEVATDLEIVPTHLLINANQMVLGGEINYRLTFIILDFLENKVKVVPGFFNSKSVILDFNYNKEHQVYNILLAEKNAQNRNQLVVKSFNNSGKVFVDQSYIFDEDLRALNGKVEIGDDLKIYFGGSYGGFKSYYSQGMYFGVLEGGKELDIQFHDLTKFEHLLDYMSEKRAKKIMTKIERGIQKDKPYEFKTQLWVQDFEEHDDFFTLLSDIYTPEYDDNYSTRYGGGNSNDSNDASNQKYTTYTSGITNADASSSIEFHESVLMIFNKKGKLLTDMSLPTPKIETLSLDRHSASSVSQNGASILYKDENDLRYKLFDNNYDTMYDSLQLINVFAQSSVPIKMTDREGRVEPWYGNHYFIWGYQRIEESTDRRRTVFFINKISITH